MPHPRYPGNELGRTGSDRTSEPLLSLPRRGRRELWGDDQRDRANGRRTSDQGCSGGRGNASSKSERRGTSVSSKRGQSTSANAASIWPASCHAFRNCGKECVPSRRNKRRSPTTKLAPCWSIYAMPLSSPGADRNSTPSSRGSWNKTPAARLWFANCKRSD